MKKILTISALVLVLSASVIAGTLAMYTTTIDNLTEGSVTAKEFTLVKGGTDTFSKDVKISPSESTSWQFSVKNYDGSVVSETAMALNFSVDVEAENGKSAIAPLVVTVKNSNGDTVGTVNSSGDIVFNDEFALSPDGQEKTYTVTVNWPGDSNTDINYAGANFGTDIKVSVTGTQV